MCVGDRKSRRSMHQERTFTFRSVADDGDSASFEAADSHLKTATDLSSMLSKLAQVPSPQCHRRRFSAPADHANAGEKSTKEILWLEASVPVSCSYREQLRANGQQTLERAKKGGCLRRPCPPPPLFPPPLLPPPTVGPALSDCGSSKQNSASDVMANQEQYMVPCQAAAKNVVQLVQAPSPVSLSQALSPTWTTPATAPCFFPEASGREMPQAPMMGQSVMPIESHHGTQFLLVPHSILPMPPTPTDASKDTDDLMAIALPQTANSQAPMMGQFVMPVERNQATQCLLVPHSILPMPLTPTGAGKDTNDLMAIAMPQATNCVMNGEQLAAHLRAAAPVQYED